MDRDNRDGLLRINVGCGQTPTPGWVNFDNSPAIWLARIPGVSQALARLPLLQAPQRAFLRFARTADVRYANATTRLPLPAASVDALYTSHMVEHFDRHEARAFLKEALRVLKPGGVLRITVPDLKYLINGYVAEPDADRFIASGLLAADKPRTLADRLRFLLVGPRHHHWMYDGASLQRLVAENGFQDVAIMPAGSTRIPSPGALDLYERADYSVTVEGIAPS